MMLLVLSNHMWSLHGVMEDASGGSRLEVSAKIHVMQFKVPLRSLIEMTGDALQALAIGDQCRSLMPGSW